MCRRFYVTTGLTLVVWFSCHSKANRKCFQVHIPLPLPKQVVIFGVGEWSWDETALLAEVLVCEDIPAQIIGTLSSQVK